ncbi:flagellar assembly peptidoglycan hydrolase FlgJ [Marinobacterium arenosum]|uniref:flagellar assembly peptidoglycan hydrolase FlgJ n=1 Tax=Marinobacterium arenosum TaxID=2862496 RepID=UPI001C9626C3|nr:flagellar assembly peptidoglycan hydrolase FlgJ [Marinobacterium arenosum]MBY4675926.1 flagellar assembly peptidoglycan hydrolase FlgJ [Marinobacterium arenosum]
MLKTPSAADSKLFTDLAELQKLKSKDNRNTPEALQAVAQEFEQLFMNMMLKSMRQANEAFGKDNFLNSNDVQFYQEMLDSQLTLELSKKQGVGLAEVMVRQLSKTLPGGGEKAASQAADNAGETVSSTGVGSAKLPRPEPAADPTALIARIVESAAVVESKQPQKQELPPHITAPDSAELQPVPVKKTEPAAVAKVLPDSFDSAEQFVSELTPLAERAAAELGVRPQVLLAQAALETGWGKHMVRREDGSNSYNLFNIKADRRWDGERASVSTLEYRDGIAQREQAAFRAYGSYQESFDDYVAFLKENPRYQQALHQAADPEAYLQELQQAGYATDPAYADKIIEIARRPLLLAGITPQDS